MPKATITESAIFDYCKLKFGGLITNPLLRPITLPIFLTADLIIPHEFPILRVTLSSLTLHKFVQNADWILEKATQSSTIVGIIGWVDLTDPEVLLLFLKYRQLAI